MNIIIHSDDPTKWGKGIRIKKLKSFLDCFDFFCELIIKIFINFKINANESSLLAERFQNLIEGVCENCISLGPEIPKLRVLTCPLRFKKLF